MYFLWYATKSKMCNFLKKSSTLLENVEELMRGGERNARPHLRVECQSTVAGARCQLPASRQWACTTGTGHAPRPDKLSTPR